MARDAHDREDFLRDARGLSPRVELAIEPAEDAAYTLLAGFRGASASVYFGQDYAVHFNDRGEVRRAYLADELLKAERGRLVAMHRERSAAEVALVSRPLDSAEQESLLFGLRKRLEELDAGLMAGEYRVIGQEPAEGDAVERLQRWLRDRQGPIVVANSPHVG